MRKEGRERGLEKGRSGKAKEKNAQKNGKSEQGKEGKTLKEFVEGLRGEQRSVMLGFTHHWEREGLFTFPDSETLLLVLIIQHGCSPRHNTTRTVRQTHRVLG